jgi:hypothetical protein
VQIAELFGAAGKDRRTKEEPCALWRREDAARGGDSRRDVRRRRSLASYTTRVACPCQ